MVLLLIFLSNQFVRYLNQAATGKFAGNVLLHLMLIEIPHLLAVLLPLGLFLAIMLAFGRMYSDNEMTVLTSCGLSQTRLTSLVLPFALLVVVVVTALSFWINPKLLAYRDQLIMQSGTALELQTMLPGRFRQANDGKQILYVQSISSNKKQMQNIFLAQLDKSSKEGIPSWILITAQSGYQMTDPVTGQQFLVTNNGKRYQGVPGSKDFQIIQYDNDQIHIFTQSADLTNEQETYPTPKLFEKSTDKTKHDALMTELEWRFSLPLSALLLTLLAIPLSQVKPRQGRYAKLLPAILIYATYINLLLVGRNWVSHGEIPPVIGLWWIHGLLILIILGIWINQNGIRSFFPSYYKKELQQ